MTTQTQIAKCQSVATPSGALHVRVDGPENGRAVLLANSLGTDIRVWDLMLPYLSPDLRVIRFDKRGHGLSDCPSGPYAIADLVADAGAVLDALGVHQVSIIGLSIGGLIAQGLALQRPNDVRAIVLMDTAMKLGSAQMWQDRIAALRAGGIEGMADAVLDRWFAPEIRGDAIALAPWRNMLTRTPLEGYIGCCAAIAGADFSDTAAGITAPVTVICGAQDQATPPDLVRATADHLGAPFHLIDGAGHLPCVERPEKVAAIITAFLERT